MWFGPGGGGILFIFDFYCCRSFSRYQLTTANTKLLLESGVRVFLARVFTLCVSEYMRVCARALC